MLEYGLPQVDIPSLTNSQPKHSNNLMLTQLNPVQSSVLEKITLEPPTDVNHKSNDSLASALLNKLGISRTGYSNTQLDRPLTFEETAKARADKALWRLIPRPFEALPDFLRCIGVVNRLQFDTIKHYLFAKDDGTGQKKCIVDARGEPFVLVKGIKEFSNTLKDMDNKGLIGWEYVDMLPIKVNHRMLLTLLQVEPLACYEEDEYIGLDDPNSLYRVCVNLSGRYFENMDVYEFRCLLEFLAINCGLRVTRLDIRVDIPKGYRVQAMAFGASLEHREEDNRLVYPQRTIGLSGSNNGKGFDASVYVGSPNSLFRLVIYDTGAKHGYSADRIEARFKQAKAHEAVLSILGQVQTHTNSDNIMTLKHKSVIRRDMQRHLSNLLFGQCYFIKANGVSKRANGAIKGIDEADWWQAVRVKCLATDPVKVKIKARETTVHEINIPWWAKQWSKQLYIAIKGLGEYGFLKIVKSLASHVEKTATDEINAMAESLKMKRQALLDCFAS